MTKWSLTCGSGLALLFGAALAAEWQPAKGPLATRWTREVSPDKAWPEYPRPQLVRKEWLNLNGLWDYAIVAKDAPQPKGWDGKILVPFPVESALSGVMKRVDEKQRLWYRRTFDVPAAWKGKRVLLHFEAVDWETTVTLNGKELGTHRGGYDPFSFDITDALKAEGAQELVLAVWDPTDAGFQPIGKQRRNPGGIMYTATSGIWQTVWLEPVPIAYVDSLRIDPDVDAGLVRITVKGAGQWRKPPTAEIVVRDGARQVATGRDMVDSTIALRIPDARLWSPDTPFLYDLAIKLGEDAVESYFGMRKIALGKDEAGIVRMMLNGKPVFHIGPLDQGFWPDGLHTAPCDEALRYDIEMTKKLGMNCARKHTKYEPDRWYYWCDKLGLMVWQDMPSMFVGPPQERKDKAGKVTKPGPEAFKRFEEAKKNFEVELVRMIECRRNHPSIVMWVPFNEGWGQHDTARYCDLIKKLDPTRLVNNASGWTDMKVGDVHDIHAYPGPGMPPLSETRAAVLGEFGGLGLGIDGHTWTAKHWGYRGAASREDLTKQYVKLLQKVYQLRDKGLCGAIYTQTSDVETECNGLMTYDRELVKLDPETAAKANRGEFPPPPEVKVIVPTSEKEAIAWRYTTEKPADDWFKPDFDDKGWKEGTAGFGTRGTPGTTVRTEWRTPDIWLRRTVELPEGKLANPHFWAHHDEDCEVYVNGVLAARAQGFTTHYDELAMTPQGVAALKPGKNVIAVHCRQTMGGQYIDLGIVDLVPKAK